MSLKVHCLYRLLEVEGTGSSAIPYLGYVEVNLQIPGIRGNNEDILLLVILTMTYSEKVPVKVGSKIIDREKGIITTGELVRATPTGNRPTLVGLSLDCSSCPAKVQGEWGFCKEGHFLCSP